MEFMITFRLRHEGVNHPTFPAAHRDGYVTIDAPSEADARCVARRHLGNAWGNILPAHPTTPALYPLGELARIRGDFSRTTKVELTAEGRAVCRDPSFKDGPFMRGTAST